jgi:MFS family permease
MSTPRTNTLIAACVVAHTLWTSAAPALVYRLYAQEWHLTPTVTAALFAIYPIVVVVTLTVFGDLSDHIGRRAAMLIGLLFSLAGTLFFAVAPNIQALFLGRALMGIGVGLTAGPSTAAVVEFAPATAALVTTVAQATGFAAALLLGGALVQYAPWPLQLSFWILAALLALLIAAVWFLPRYVPAAGRRWHPRIPTIPQSARPAFILSSLAATTAYTHGVLVLSFGGQIAHDLVGAANTLASGAILSLFAIAFGATSPIARILPARAAIAAGAIASAAGMGLLSLAVARHDPWIFLLATATSGVGYSLLFLGGLSVISAAAPPDQRGGILSALYLLCYLTMGATAIVLGRVATTQGLDFAVDLGALAIAALSLATLVCSATKGHSHPAAHRSTLRA